MRNPAFLQPAPRVLGLAVCLVRGHPRERHPGVDGALQHQPEVLVLGHEADLIVDAGCPAAVPVIGPGDRR